MKKARSFIMLGLDGAIPEFVLKYVKKKKLPNLARLMRAGAFMRAYPTPPCDTPTNWATIATGSPTAVHGITGFRVHRTRDPLSKTFGSLNTKLCRAEYIWNVAERAGKKCLIVTYPGACPSTLRRGVVLRGMHSEGENKPSTRATMLDDMSIDSYAFYHNGHISDKRPTRHRVYFAAAPDNLLRTAGVSHGQCTQIALSDSAQSVKDHHLVIGGQGPGKFRTAVLLSGKRRIAELKEGQWSEWIRADFLRARKRVEGCFRLKLVRLAPDSSEFLLYRTTINKSTGWATPRSWERTITRNVGQFQYGFEHGCGRDPLELTFEQVRMQTDYYADLAAFMKKRIKWDFMMMKLHVQDNFNHWFMNQVHPPSPIYQEKNARKVAAAFERSYVEVDRFIGRVLKRCANSSTLVCVVSDHGALPTEKKISFRKVFTEAGFTHYRFDPATGKYGIDWGKTSACLINDQIYINLKGRNAGGVVSPGRHFEKIRNDVIDALRRIRDAETGRCPVALALRREDAEFLGVDGDRCGDIYCALEPGYWFDDFQPFHTFPTPHVQEKLISPNLGENPQGVHHGFLPSATTDGWASDAAFALLSGPGVRRGVLRDRPAWLSDLAPTICSVMGWKNPAQATGAVLQDIIK